MKVLAIICFFLVAEAFARRSRESDESRSRGSDDSDRNYRHRNLAKWRNQYSRDLHRAAIRTRNENKNEVRNPGPFSQFSMPPHGFPVPATQPPATPRPAKSFICLPGTITFTAAVASCSTLPGRKLAMIRNRPEYDAAVAAMAAGCPGAAAFIGMAATGNAATDVYAYIDDMVVANPGLCPAGVTGCPLAAPPTTATDAVELLAAGGGYTNVDTTTAPVAASLCEQN